MYCSLESRFISIMKEAAVSHTPRDERPCQASSSTSRIYRRITDETIENASWNLLTRNSVSLHILIDIFEKSLCTNREGGVNVRHREIRCLHSPRYSIPRKLPTQQGGKSKNKPIHFLSLKYTTVVCHNYNSPSIRTYSCLMMADVTALEDSKKFQW